MLIILNSSCGREEESCELPLCIIFDNKEKLTKIISVQPSELRLKIFTRYYEICTRYVLSLPPPR